MVEILMLGSAKQSLTKASTSASEMPAGQTGLGTGVYLEEEAVGVGVVVFGGGASHEVPSRLLPNNKLPAATATPVTRWRDVS